MQVLSFSLFYEVRPSDNLILSIRSESKIDSSRRVLVVDFSDRVNDQVISFLIINRYDISLVSGENFSDKVLTV